MILETLIQFMALELQPKVDDLARQAELQEKQVMALQVDKDGNPIRQNSENNEEQDQAAYKDQLLVSLNDELIKQTREAKAPKSAPKGPDIPSKKFDPIKVRPTPAPSQAIAPQTKTAKDFTILEDNEKTKPKNSPKKLSKNETTDRDGEVQPSKIQGPRKSKTNSRKLEDRPNQRKTQESKLIIGGVKKDQPKISIPSPAPFIVKKTKTPEVIDRSPAIPRKTIKRIGPPKNEIVEKTTIEKFRTREQRIVQTQVNTPNPQPISITPQAQKVSEVKPKEKVNSDDAKPSPALGEEGNNEYVDFFGNPIKIDPEIGYVERTVFDDEGNLVSISEPVDSSLLFRDSNGNILSVDESGYPISLDIPENYPIESLAEAEVITDSPLAQVQPPDTTESVWDFLSKQPSTDVQKIAQGTKITPQGSNEDATGLDTENPMLAFDIKGFSFRAPETFADGKTEAQRAADQRVKNFKRKYERAKKAFEARKDYEVDQELLHLLAVTDAFNPEFFSKLVEGDDSKFGYQILNEYLNYFALNGDAPPVGDYSMGTIQKVDQDAENSETIEAKNCGCGDIEGEPSGDQIELLLCETKEKIEDSFPAELPSMARAFLKDQAGSFQTTAGVRPVLAMTSNERPLAFKSEKRKISVDPKSQTIKISTLSNGADEEQVENIVAHYQMNPVLRYDGSIDDGKFELTSKNGGAKATCIYYLPQNLACRGEFQLFMTTNENGEMSFFHGSFDEDKLKQDEKGNTI